MKLYSALLTAALLTLAVSTSAHAANYTGSLATMGTVALGETGTLSDSYDEEDLYSNVAKGILPKYSQITFTYSLSGMDLASATETAKGSYKFTEAGTAYKGSYTTVANGTTTVTYSAATVDGVDSTPLVITYANLPNSNEGVTIIKNLSSQNVSFVSSILAYFLADGSLAAKYAVTAIPLPAALPLFGTALLGLAAARRRKKAA